MACKGLDGLASADIPVLGVGVDGTGDEGVVVGKERETHDVTIVTLELADLDTTLNVPQHAGSITRGGDDLLVVDKAAAREVSSVGVQFTAHLQV